MARRIAVILIGPQGSGKGTQASIIQHDGRFCYIAGGNITRTLARQHSELGHVVRTLMNEGQLLPDTVINSGAGMLIHHCHRHLLFDGYPRTTSQAIFLHKALGDLDITAVAIEMHLDDAESIKRIKNRFVCSHCGSVIYTYARQHLNTLQKQRQSRGRCIHCGGTLEKRSDDTEESVRERLMLYHKQTRPMLEYFRDLRILHTIDARPSIEDVAAKIHQIITDVIH